MSKKKIAISVDSSVNEELEEKKINKSKLINHLISEFFKNKKNKLDDFLKNK